MKVVIDRLTDDHYGRNFHDRCVGREVIIDDEFDSTAYDYTHPDYGYCKGYYINDNREGKYCYSFTCVCVGDDGQAL